jgi:hypothetical protein
MLLTARFAVGVFMKSACGRGMGAGPL